MKSKDLYDYGYGAIWDTVYTKYKEGYSTSVTDYHQHEFYEINLILSGNVKILLKDRFVEGTKTHLVLTAPGTPHYIACHPDTLYRRLYLVFTRQFVENYLPEWRSFSRVFGESGRVLTLTTTQVERIQAIIGQIGQDGPFEQRLLIYYLLAQIHDLCPRDHLTERKIPSYILEALSYIEHHCSEKIVAAELARSLYIGRTSLMTEFKKYTGRTLGEYMTWCRIQKAILILLDGKTLEAVAEECGFSDSSGLIRAFRRCLGTTPHEYLKAMTAKNGVDSLTSFEVIP